MERKALEKQGYIPYPWCRMRTRWRQVLAGTMALLPRFGLADAAIVLYTGTLCRNIGFHTFFRIPVKNAPAGRHPARTVLRVQ
jgi:hypothetical protein